MEKYTVKWTDDAVDDFDNIIGYIFKENETNAKEMYLAIKKQCQELDYFPFRGHVVPELQALGFTYYRELIYKRWRIIYSIEGKNVYLLLIVDSRQDMKELLVQRLLNQK
jgi:plasmid stabilization system protein ParE